MKKQFLKAIKLISEVLTSAGATQEYEEFTTEEQEFYEILLLCYELLARTTIAREQLVKQPDVMKEPGFEDEYVNRYGITADELADFAFSLGTLSGKINMVALFNQTLERARFAPKSITSAQISESTGISTNTISTFRNGKGNITANNLETIINYILSR